MTSQPICDEDTPDPWMVAAPDGRSGFYFTFTLGNRVEIWQSPAMDNFRGCRKSVVWQPPPGAPWSADIWAPELHYLRGTWYIYTCAAPPNVGNPGHRTVLLRSSQQDPMVASGWQFLGPIPGMPEDQWAIDATVFSPDNVNLFCCWSGWSLYAPPDTEQDLFLIRMKSPEEAIAGTRVCISQAQLPWERPDGGKRGVNEGPTWVSSAAFRGIVYSAHGSWTSEYKLGLLAFLGGEPLRPESWVKRPEPLLVSDPAHGGPFGPGHASLLPSPYPGDPRLFCVYHATAKEGEGWANRKARILCLDPSCFAPQARPVCCGVGPVLGVIGGNSAQGGHPGYVPGQAAHQSNFVDQISPELGKLFGKASKFFK